MRVKGSSLKVKDQQVKVQDCHLKVKAFLFFTVLTCVFFNGYELCNSLNRLNYLSLQNSCDTIKINEFIVEDVQVCEFILHLFP